MTTLTSQHDSDDPQESFRLTFARGQRDLGRFNLAVFGMTGAGKSTLVNAVFGADVAPTGVGEPVTRETTYHEHPSGLFGMFDCVGIETGQGRESLLDGLRDEVLQRRARPIEEQIHVAWYVLRWSDRRFDDGQADFVRELHGLGLPVVVVFSQVPRLHDGRMPAKAEQLADTVRDKVGGVIVGGSPVFTHAIADQEFGHPVHGLQELLDATFRAAPAGVRDALNAAQRVDMERKRVTCSRIIAGAGSSAAAVGATPIPFSDAALLVPLQVGMMAAVANQYALPVSPLRHAQLAAKATVALGGLSLVGRGLAANLAKLFPGVGSVVGGAINAAIAATLTMAIGRAWMVVCERLSRLSPEQIEALLSTGDELELIFMTAFESSAEDDPAEAPSAAA